jgi:protease YdgD
MKALVMSKNLNCLEFLTKRRWFTATILSIGSCLGAIATTLQPSQALVIGQDNRVTPTYEWLTRSGQQRAAVGLLSIQMADGKFIQCTYTVVGRNIGLTNTHCIYDEQGRPPQQIKAYAARHSNRAYAVANVDRFWTGLDAPPKTLAESASDWAIVRFTTNLGDQTGWFGNYGWSGNINDAGSSVVNQTTNYIGYPGDWPTDAAIQPGQTRSYTPALHAGCKIVDRQVGLLLHNCDTNPGASGSSLYGVVSDTDLRTMGLHRGSVSLSNGSSINTAVPLERFMPAIEKLRQTGATADTIVPRP